MLCRAMERIAAVCPRRSARATTSVHKLQYQWSPCHDASATRQKVAGARCGHTRQNTVSKAMQRKLRTVGGTHVPADNVFKHARLATALTAQHDYLWEMQPSHTGGVSDARGATHSSKNILEL